MTPILSFADKVLNRYDLLTLIDSTSSTAAKLSSHIRLLSFAEVTRPTPTNTLVSGSDKDWSIDFPLTRQPTLPLSEWCSVETETAACRSLDMTREPHS